MKTIILTGGGTAGHVIPHLAMLEQLKAHFDKIVYIGSESGIERSLIEPTGIKYYPITTVKFIRAFTLKNLLIPFKLIKGIFECKKIIKQVKPNIVFSKGGFVAVPVALAASNLKVPIVAHESDLTLGLANKIIYKKCKVMCTSFEKTSLNLKKGFYSGSPIRSALFNGEKIKAPVHIDTSKKTLLVMGGSLGAKAINEMMFNIADNICKTMNVIHLVGKGNMTNKKLPTNYNQVEFSNEMEHIFAATDYIVSRAGSNSIFEFLILKKPMLLIPLPLTQSRGDQIANAEYFKANGYANTIEQEKLNQKELLVQIDKLVSDATNLIKNMEKHSPPNGCDEIIKKLLKYNKPF